MRIFSGLMILLIASALGAQTHVPLLELKQVKGEWAWHAGGKQADEAAVKLALTGFAKLQDEKAGWKGLGANGISQNLLVMHAPGLAPSKLVIEMLWSAAAANIWQIAVGSPEAVSALPATDEAPDKAKLDAAYLYIELPIDEGLSSMPSVPRERVSVQCNYDSDEDAGSYVVAIDSRGRKPVEGSSVKTWRVAYSEHEPVAGRTGKMLLRTARQSRIAAAVHDYIDEINDRAEELVIGVGGDEYRPWLFLELAARALEQVNAEREKAGAKKLAIGWGTAAPEPPPEMPPEGEVEYPKDEPTQEDPTEDPRIVEDPNDGVNEDPSDAPNRDLADNPNEDPSDNESPHPKKEGSTSAVGLGGNAGGGGGRGGKGGFAHRRARGGGGRPFEDRTRAALEWLKDHQNKEGYWSSDAFSDDTTRVAAKRTYNIDFVEVGDKLGDKGWTSTCDVGLTGLALLAFAGSGYDHKEGDYRATCRSAILYLRKVQDNEGCFGTREDDHYVYNHAVATMAMAEIYGLSNDQVIKPIVDKAVTYILKAQNPGLGWRYGVQPGVNDSSVTSWMVMALRSAKLAGIEFDSTKAYADAAKWFEAVAVDVMGYPKCGYDSPGSNNARLRSAQDYENNPSMDAVYINCMLAMEKADLNNSNIKSLSRGCVEKPFLPTWDHYKIDYFYWYYATMALYQVGGSAWKTWERAMSMTLLDNQRGWHAKDKQAKLTAKETLDEHGSWDSVDAWGTAGGRVYSTAMATLTLQTYYRYLRIEEQK